MGQTPKLCQWNIGVNNINGLFLEYIIWEKNKKFYFDNEKDIFFKHWYIQKG